MDQSRNSTRRTRRHDEKYGMRFAGEVFAHEGNPQDGPVARKLTSEIAWKQPPSAKLKAEVSV
jgi:hypothetical protein